MKRYFITNNVYLLSEGKVYRWSTTRNAWLRRDGFKPSDLTDGTVIGAIEVSEAQALDNISQLVEMAK